MKDILKEDRSLNELNRVLQEKFYNTSKELLYRGTDKEVDRWQTFSIRKDRKPKDTPVDVDAIIAGLEEDGAYSEYPSRRKSKFAATSGYTVDLFDFGDNVYITFPHETADISSLTIDSIDFFADASIYFMKAFGTFKNVERRRGERFYESREFDTIYKFLESYRTFKDSGNENTEVLKIFAEENWKKFKSEVMRGKDLKVDGTTRKFIQGCESALTGINKIERYFNYLELGIKPNSFEVMFDGPEYLLVERSYFSDNFKWDGNKWSLKRT